MKMLLVKVAVLISLAASVDPAHAEGCDGARSGIGAVIGIAVGTVLLPGLGTLWGAALGGGGTCGYDYVKRWLSTAPRDAAIAEGRP